ncbi:MAG: hypothetical protein AB8B78_13235 [Polaribacter sp.]
MVDNWNSFDDGITINSLGSEKGKIIFDEENNLGGRITIEKGTDVAPFSITFGIYNLMFLTEYFNNKDETFFKVKIYKLRIEKILNHIVISEKKERKIGEKNITLC